MAQVKLKPEFETHTIEEKKKILSYLEDKLPISEKDFDKELYDFIKRSGIKN